VYKKRVRKKVHSCFLLACKEESTFSVVLKEELQDYQLRQPGVVILTYNLNTEEAE
jgi:hypothetical protein